MKPAQSFYSLLAVLCIVFASCNNSTKPPASQVITPANLTEQYFAISTDVDTTLTTKEGIRVHIPGGSIQADGKRVTVVIKEALSLYDMLNGGLTTMSGKELLRSNGMFYISTKEASKIVKPLQVEVPAVYADTSMKLYSGVEKEGRIDWEEPKSLQSSDTANCDARLLFNNNCASCHAIAKKLTGPALANVENRWPNKRHLIEFIRNNQAVIHSGKCAYAVCLYDEYNKTPMNTFPSLSDDDIECLLKYFRRETERLGVTEFPKKTSAAEDSTNLAYLEKLWAKREAYMEENGAKVEYNRNYDTAFTVSVDSLLVQPVIIDTKKVVPPYENAEYYKITINTYGWHNIDCILDMPDVANSKLVVKKKGVYSDVINMYLVIPSYKVFVEGGLLENKVDYGFYAVDGNISLPMNKDAFIIAIGEKGGRIFYGQRYFRTSPTQTIEMSIEEVSKRELEKNLENLKMEDATFEVKKTKHFKDMKALDKEIERMKEKVKGVICNCQHPIGGA
ncbi:Cytochrome c551/c552 [Filimonas lacunae]|uniref:Cytochrome c551/c552 n=1 Tax=Filimonas lacunae TaxID=477680 RepID=A0A173MR09_9BACT|nr:cytochrome c [Filimonas lacunae]BAV09936.1 cytochrome C [Filimonas lacunae]SIS81359.1 Cytochrome c551/c552 [Filimonas lacunae]